MFCKSRERTYMYVLQIKGENIYIYICTHIHVYDIEYLYCKTFTSYLEREKEERKRI